MWKKIVISKKTKISIEVIAIFKIPNTVFWSVVYFEVLLLLVRLKRDYTIVKNP